MEVRGCSKKEELRPQLLDLVPRDRERLTNREESGSHSCSVDKKLELRLGLPCEDWSSNENTKTGNREIDGESLLFLGYFGSHNQSISSWSPSSFHGSTEQLQQQMKTPTFLPFPSNHTQQSPSCSKAVDSQNAEKKPFSPSSAIASVTGNAQKRTAPGPVVGWPPIRSFRKNLASSSTKSVPESPSVVPNKLPSEKQVESGGKGLFVKINMDGVPIGRKVDLNAYDSYEKLSSAVDELFRGLLSAQRDLPGGGIQNKKEEEKPITGLLDGSGEYTLVYEDNEGDRVLVGDVPWHMFVSTVKRLRVLKSSELPALSLGGCKPEKMVVDGGIK